MINKWRVLGIVRLQATELVCMKLVWAGVVQCQQHIWPPCYQMSCWNSQVGCRLASSSSPTGSPAHPACIKHHISGCLASQYRQVSLSRHHHLLITIRGIEHNMQAQHVSTQLWTRKCTGAAAVNIVLLSVLGICMQTAAAKG